MTTNFNEVWTEKRIARLTELWAKGWSCTNIAADLGGFGDCAGSGRSAVIGKIHRLKLPQPLHKLSPSGRRAPRSPVLTPPSHNILASIAIAGTEPGLPERLHGDLPDGTGIKLTELTAATCHWPKGDPLDDNFEFCGGAALKDMPYCAHHSHMARRPSTRAERGV